jgi:hypothetical protein
MDRMLCDFKIGKGITSMKAVLVVFALLCSLSSAAIAETVTLKAGPEVSVSYNAGDWKSFSSIRNSESNAIQSTTWKFLRANKDFVEITVASRPEKKDDGEFKRDLLNIQKLRGDAAILVRERRASVAGRDWLVLELRNPHTRPPRNETSYFLPTEDGHITIFVIGEEANFPKHRETIEAFFRQIQVK